MHLVMLNLPSRLRHQGLLRIYIGITTDQLLKDENRLLLSDIFIYFRFVFAIF